VGTSVDDTNTRLFIGNFDNVDNSSFDGTLDELRIYNRILSAEEIKRLYYMGSSFKLNATKRTELTDGLIGYWTFDGKDVDIGQVTAEVRDVSVSANHGDWQNHATTTAPGKIGQALRFLDVGVDDRVSMGDQAVYDFSGSFSLSAWVRIEKLTGFNQTIIAKNAPGSQTSYSLEFTPDNGPYQFFLYGSNDGTTLSGRYSASTISANEWYHVTAVYDTSVPVYHMFINGVLDDGVTYGTSPATSIYNSTAPLTIGARGGSTGGNNTVGIIDDVRVYNRALTANEARELYLMGK
jgi:hypothetical protein